MCLSVHACVYVCLSVTSHISETSEAIAIKFDTVTASVMRMHQVLIILTLTTTWHQSRPMERNHENNKCSVISHSSSNTLQVCCEDSPKGPQL